MTSGAKIIGQSTMSSSFAFSAHLGAAVIFLGFLCSA
jgi:hypothetical protein